MNWIITYRNKCGSQEQLSLEAESREAVFKELAQRGISAIRVEQASGNVKLRKASSKGGDKPSGILKGAIAGIIVVAAALGAFLLLKNDKSAPEQPKEKKSAAIAEVSPAPATPAAVEEKTEEPPKIDPNARPTKVGETVNGYIKLPSGRIHRVLGVITNSATASIKGKYEIFKHSSENEIACFLSMKPGEGLVGTPRYNGRFKRDFLESLKEPITIDPEDTPENAELKRAVIEAKKDLKAALDRGEDIEQIMLDTRKEMQDLARYKMELTQQMHQIVKSEEMTTKDMEDLLNAANEMLDAKGIAPITFGPLTRRKIMMMREKDASGGK
ncbi:MAG: hypothetical protein ACI4I0_05965 [Acutalibacteraceae bacterium]